MLKGLFGAFLLLFSTLTANANSKSLTYEVVVDGFDSAWALVEVRPGEWLISERPGRLIYVKNGEKTQVELELPDLFANAQAGLFDLVLAPDYERTGWIYFSYACGTQAANSTCVKRGRLNPSHDALIEIEPIFVNAYAKAGAAHYGGRMTWLADDTLILTLGDAFDLREQAQNLDSYLGKIVRMNADGSVPADNPFTHKQAPLIYSYGHRNVQGIVYDRQRDILWQHEHGPKGGDELNQIIAGANYGWPMTSYGIDYTGAYVTPFQTLPGVKAPLYQWTPSLAPADMALHNGDLWVAHLAGKRLQRFVWTTDSSEPSWQLANDVLVDYARFRAVASGSDGALYVLTDRADGQLLRLELF